MSAPVPPLDPILQREYAYWRQIFSYLHLTRPKFALELAWTLFELMTAGRRVEGPQR